MFTKLLRGGKPSGKRLLGNIFLEILIIILGVLLSLWISEGFKQREERRQEKQNLLQLRQDLRADLRNLQRDRSLREKQMQADREMLRLLSQEASLNDARNIAGSIRSLLNTARFATTNPTFRSLESTGQIRLIRNDTLRIGLIRLYSSGYASLDHNNDDVSAFRDQFLLPYAINHLDFRTAFNPAAITSLPPLADRQALFNMAAYLNVSVNSTVEAYQRTEKQVGSLLEIIERELE